MKRICITTGDVNGIGAEITIKALNALGLPKEQVLLISNKKILDYYGKLKVDYEIREIPYESDVLAGRVTPESGEFSFQSLKLACELAKSGEVSAIVTAPVAKIAMHKAGHIFNGQTEVLEHFLAHDNQKAEMLFVADDFRVLLLTRHVALKDLNITYDMLIEKLTALNIFFKEKFKIKFPEFALCALNPHAGENGIMGNEEKNIIIPATEKLRAIGVNVTNPLPADTLFISPAKKYLHLSDKPIYDCYIAMYHDQGLLPIKTVAAEKTVNTTIGLDVIRTSPSHGTAFGIAGKNQASELSMVEAINEALKFVS